LPKYSTPSWMTLGAAALVAVLLAFAAGRVQPARAQVGQPLSNDFPITAEGGPGIPPTATQVQALDATRFVVVTREPRLVRKANATDGPWQNMLVTVVTHYTVHENRLVAIEHVRVPQGYRAYGQ
jgi:hypothetical protein